MYRHIGIKDVVRFFLMPIQLGQFALWVNENGEPFAFITWAWLDDKREELLLADSYIKPLAEDWQSGHKLWLMDFVCPYGHPSPLIYELREKFFADCDSFSAIRRSPDGSKKLKTYSIPRIKAHGQTP